MGLFSRPFLHANLLVIIILTSTAFGSLRLAGATQSYTPGVSVGDSITYGQLSVTTSPGTPPPSGTEIFNESRSITDTVTAVDLSTKVVTASQIYDLKNGTIFRATITGSVLDGSGNLSIFILAGGLNVGDQIYRCGLYCANSFFGPISDSVTKEYAGGIRTVNQVGGRIPQSGGFSFLQFSWDRQTGFLLEAIANATAASSSTGGSFSIRIKATSTNVWASSSAMDFSFDATTTTFLYNYIGQTTRYNLNLTSYNNLATIINLTPILQNSSLAHPPTLALGQSSLNLLAGSSVYTTLTFTTSPATLTGLYFFSLTASGGGITHADNFFLIVQAPSFELLATPQGPQIAPGAQGSSTITVSALGLFTGIVSLSVNFGSNLLHESLNATSVTLSSTLTSHNITLTISVNQYAPPGTLYGQIEADSFSSNGPVSQYVQVFVQVGGPSFTIFTETSSLSISPGGTASVRATILSLGGFAGPVHLWATAYDLAATLNSTSATLASGSSAHASLTISVPNNVPAGFYSASVHASSDILSATAYVTVNVGGPDFSMSANPASFSLLPGTTVSSNITATSQGGFHGTITLAATEQDPLAYNFSSATLNLVSGGTATTKLTVSIPSRLPSTYSALSIDGSNGQSSHTTQVFFNSLPTHVITPGQPYFTLSVNPRTLTLDRATSGSYTVGLNSINGFQGPVNLTATVFCNSPGPGCPSPSLTQSVVTIPAGGVATSTLNIQVPASASPGTYTVEVQATNGTYPFFAVQDVNLVVQAPDFQVFFNTNNVDLAQGDSAAPKAIITSLLGFSGSIQLTATINGPGCPGIDCPSLSFSQNPVTLTAGQTSFSTVSITTFQKSTPGYYSVDLQATNGTVTHYDYMSFNLEGTTFDLSDSPYPLILPSGGSGTLSSRLASLNGFSGKVQLTATGNGVAVTFTPVNVTLSAGGYVTTTIPVSAASLNPGSYNVNIEARNGTTTSYDTVQVIVVAPDFAVKVIGPSSSIQAGTSSNQQSVVLASLDGLQSSVSLSGTVENGPSGACPGINCPTIILNPASESLASGGWAVSNFTINVPGNAPAGYYTGTVIGQVGSIQHQATFSFYVEPLPLSLLSVVVGSDGLLYYSHYSGSWNRWTALQGSSASAPSLCSSGPGNAELFVRGKDNGIYHMSFAAGIPGGTWDSPGGSTIDRPACVFLNGVFYLAVRGSDNGLYLNTYASGHWGTWISLNGTARSPPVIVSTPAVSRLDVVVRGMDNGVYHRSLSNGFWSAWDSPGGSTIDTPAATSDNFNLYVVVRGSDNATYISSLYFFGGSWGNWASLGGKIISTPYIGFDHTGNMHILVRGLDNGIYHIEKPAGGFLGTDWGLPIGYTQDPPSAQDLGSGLVLVVRGGDNGIYYQPLTGVTLTGWLNMGGSTHLAPSLSIS